MLTKFKSISNGVELINFAYLMSTRLNKLFIIFRVELKSHLMGKHHFHSLLQEYSVSWNSDAGGEAYRSVDDVCYIIRKRHFISGKSNYMMPRPLLHGTLKRLWLSLIVVNSGRTNVIIYKCPVCAKAYLLIPFHHFLWLSKWETKQTLKFYHSIFSTFRICVKTIVLLPTVFSPNESFLVVLFVSIHW